MKKPLALPTYQKDLALFTFHLREALSLRQEEVAAHFYLDRSRISKYENGKTDDKPRAGYLAGLAVLIAEQADDQPAAQHLLLKAVNEAIHYHYRQRRFQNWAALAGKTNAYLANQRAKFEAQHSPDWQATLEKRLDLPPVTELVGVREQLDHLAKVVLSPVAPWIVCIDGMGGIGKTALANAFIRQASLSTHYQSVAWINAKQQSFLPGVGMVAERDPVLTLDALTDTLLAQLDPQRPPTLSPTQKKVALIDRLNQGRYFIVIDNLETIEQYQTLVPSLQKLANPSKFLLTSRHSLRTYPDVFCLSLGELGQTHTLRLIRQEAGIKGLPNLAEASEDALIKIYDVVGGNPLALKLVVGQLTVLSLPQVLTKLKNAPDKNVEALYTYIYWQAWEMLDGIGQKVLLTMPLAQRGDIDHLLSLTKFNQAALTEALQRLARLSLVQIGGTHQARRYSIHRLTETFILNEAIEWKLV